MTTKVSQLKGLKIVTRDTGKVVKNVEEIIFDPATNSLLALIVDPGGFLSTAKVVMFNDVESVGKDAIVIANESVLKNLGDVQERVSEINSENNYLVRSKVMTESGDEIGTITDIYFDEKTGVVDGFEVSQGPAQDLRSGRVKVSLPDIVTVGKDLVIVNDSATASLEPQGQGLEGVIDRGKQAISQVRENAEASKAQDKVGELVGNLREKAEELRDRVEEKLTDAGQAVNDRRKDDAVGKYASKNIIAPNNEVILVEGELITYDSVKIAERYGILEQVLMNTK